MSFVVPAHTVAAVHTVRQKNIAMALAASAVGVARKEPVRGVPIRPPAVMNVNGFSHSVAVGTVPVQLWRLRHRAAAVFGGHPLTPKLRPRAAYCRLGPLQEYPET